MNAFEHVSLMLSAIVKETSAMALAVALLKPPEDSPGEDPTLTTPEGSA
jgi:hypothetical protein